MMMSNDNKIAVKLLALGHFTLDTYSGFLNPIMPFIAAKIGIGIAVTTVLMSLSYLLSSLMQPLFGFLSDKYKKRFFIVTGMFLISIFIPLTGWATLPWALGLFILLGNLGNGFFHPQATGFTFLFAKNNEGLSVGKFLTMGTLGFAFGPLLSSSVVKFFGLETLPYTCIFGVILSLCFLKFVPKVSDKKDNEQKITLIDALKKVIKSSVTRILIGLSIVKSLVSVVFCLLLPFLWKQIGLDVFQIGIIISSYTLMGAIATYVSPKLERIFGTKKIFMASMVLVAPITVLMFLTLHKYTIISVILFIMLGFITFLSNTLNMVLTQKLHPEIKSMISGFIGGFSWGSVGIMLSTIGYIAQKVGIIWVLSFISIVPLIYSLNVLKIPDEILVKGEK